ncbi:MAG TPA: hypothetical protein VKA27_00630 [Sunxiuqinia sp.]|nr:hypothetical protein [Sunxiuqinia sp.]
MGLNSKSKKEVEANGKMQEPFELVSCPRGGIICTEHRAIINTEVVASRKYFFNKEYNESINELKSAFQQTTNLQEPVCQQCVELFQTSIIRSMEAIQSDLKKMTTGFFKANRYKSSLEFAKSSVDELKTQVKKK